MGFLFLSLLFKYSSELYANTAHSIRRMRCYCLLCCLVALFTLVLQFRERGDKLSLMSTVFTLVNFLQFNMFHI